MTRRAGHVGHALAAGLHKRTAVVGLSQGGAASMLVSLQSSPDLTIVAAGHSLLLGDEE
jgi:hypothetical protein